MIVIMDVDLIDIEYDSSHSCRFNSIFNGSYQDEDLSFSNTFCPSLTYITITISVIGQMMITIIYTQNSNV